MAQTRAAPTLAEGPVPLRWTREEYMRLSEGGFLGPEPRTELIDGQILQKMSQGNAHILAVKLTFYALQAALGKAYHLGMQVSLPLGDSAMPEPDLVVLRGHPRDYDGRDPDPRDDVMLVVEVSDTTLAFDRSVKTVLYASQGISEYWLLDLRHRRLEIRRRPLGEGYAETIVLEENQAVSIHDGEILVGDLLPRAE